MTNTQAQNSVESRIQREIEDRRRQVAIFEHQAATLKQEIEILLQASQMLAEPGNPPDGKLPPADLELVAIWNRNRYLTRACREITLLHGQLFIPDAAAAYLASTHREKDDTPASVSERIRHVVARPKLWTRIRKNTYRFTEQPEDPPAPEQPASAPPAEDVCPNCRSLLLQVDEVDNMGRIEPSLKCLTCGKPAANEQEV